MGDMASPPTSPMLLLRPDDVASDSSSVTEKSRPSSTDCLLEVPVGSPALNHAEAIDRDRKKVLFEKEFNAFLAKCETKHVHYYDISLLITIVVT